MRCVQVRYWCILLAGLTCCSGVSHSTSAQAGLVAVDWRGDYVSKSLQLAGHNPALASSSDKYGDPDTAGVYTGRLVSNSTPYNPSLADGYNTAAPSAVFYGGHAVEWATSTGNTGFTNLSVENQGTTDALQLEIKANSGPASDLVSYASVFYWQKKDFLNGLNNKVVDLSDTFFTLKTTQVSVPSQNPDQLRWVIRNGTSDFYISDLVANVLNNSDYAFTSYAPVLTWKTYDPLAGLAGIHWSSGTAVSAATLTNITAFGFYLDYGALAHAVDMKITQFLVTAKGNGNENPQSTTPEPGFALAGLCGVAFFGVRQLKKHRSRKSASTASMPSTPAMDESPVGPVGA